MKTKAEEINRFFKLSNEAFGTDNDFIYQDMGVSKDEYLNSKLNVVKRAKLKAKAQLNKNKNEDLLARSINKVKNIINSSNDNLKQGLKSLILEKSPQFQFRNIEKLDENDLKELLTDLNILNEIDNLDRTDQNDK